MLPSPRIRNLAGSTEKQLCLFSTKWQASALQRFVGRYRGSAMSRVKIRFVLRVLDCTDIAHPHFRSYSETTSFGPGSASTDGDNLSGHRSVRWSSVVQATELSRTVLRHAIL